MDNKTSIEAVAELLPRLTAQQQREVQDFAFLLQKTLEQEVQTGEAGKQGRRGGLGIARGKVRIAEDLKSIPEGFGS